LAGIGISGAGAAAYGPQLSAVGMLAPLRVKMKCLVVRVAVWALQMSSFTALAAAAALAFSVQVL
jgi:hypothetical protein